MHAIPILAGFIEPTGSAGEFRATAASDSAETKAAIANLEATGEALAAGSGKEIATNIKLVGVCVEALPGMLTGKVKITDVMFPGGAPELVEPIYKNPKLSAPFNEQLTAVIRSYVVDRMKVLGPGEKVRLVEVSTEMKLNREALPCAAINLSARLPGVDSD